MKHKLLAISLLCLALGSASIHADLLYWSANGTALGGSTGTWDTTNQRWGTSTSGPFTTVWNNANTDSATLSASGTAFGTVVLGANVTMNGTLSIEQTPGTWPAWTINGANTLTFGVGSTLQGPATGSSSINGKYAGTITKTGASTIIFNNSGGSVTKFILKQGISTFSSGNRFGSGADRSDFLTFDGGQTRADIVAWGSFGKSISLTANGGTINGSASTVTMTADKPISSTGSGRLTINLAQLTLSNIGNNWTGPMTINGSGTKVTLGAAGVIPDTCVLTVNGTLAMANFSETISSLAGSGSITLGSGTLSLADGRNTFSGVISGTGGLAKNGSNIEILSGANTFSGATTINAGTLTLGSPSALANSQVVIVAPGVLDVNGQSPAIAGLSGSGVISNNAGCTLTVNGNLTTGGGTSIGLYVYSCYSGTLTNGSLYKSGTHAMALRGSNTFDGTLSFDNGTLSVGAAPDRLPIGTILNFSAPALFQLDANSQTVNSLGGNGNLNLGGGTLNIDPGASAAFFGVIQNSELAGSSTALGHGLRGYYYTNQDMTALGAVRDDATVSFPDLTSGAQLPDGVYPGTNTISIRWLGQVLTTAAGTYKFTTACDDGSRLWVNGALLVDNWVSQGVVPKSGTINLAANTRYDIVMEYFNGTGGAGATLSWTPPNDLTTNTIPTDYLFLPGAGQLVKAGAGYQYLVAANTYTGGTRVTGAGSVLEGQVDGALGGGNVAVDDGAMLQLDTPATLSTNADIIMSGAAPMMVLNFSGASDIHALSFDGGATYQPAGTYGSSFSGAAHQDDTRFNPSYAGMLNVVAAPSAIALITSASPAVYGSPVSLTATVTPPGATGTVTFYDGANFLGAAALDGSGIATLSVSNLQVSASPHAITAAYSGDAVHSPRTSSAASITTTPALLTPNIVIANRAYDSTTNATISSATTFTGILNNDTNYVHIAGTAVASFQDKNIGTAKPVDVTGLALSGSLASNYLMPATTASVTANITAKALTVTGLAGVSRGYDGTTNAMFTGTAVLNGVIGTEDVTLNTNAAVASFATKTVGTGKIVTVNGYTLNGVDAGNYSVTPPTVTANITAVSLSVVGLTANNRPYDGTTNATLSGTAALSAGVVSGDIVTLSGTPLAWFANKTAGTAKPVTVTGFTITGADAANYTLAQPAGLTATISPDATTCALVSSANPSTATSNVTFTATLNGVTPAADSPTGSIVFLTNNVLAVIVPLTAGTPGSATAAYSTTALPAGTTTVAAQYAGDANFGAINNSLQQVVNSGSICSQTNKVLSLVNNLDSTITVNCLGTPQAGYYVLTATDAAAAMSSWTVVAGSTNTVTDVNGLWSFTVTNTMPRQFYRPAAVNACP